MKKMCCRFMVSILIFLCAVYLNYELSSGMFIITEIPSQRERERQLAQLQTGAQDSTHTSWQDVPQNTWQNTSGNQSQSGNIQGSVPSRTNPLTSMATLGDITLRRPVAVVLSNQRAALPTNAVNGISQADILYEFPVEGGVTRFLGIFQEHLTMSTVGSIRSARHYIVSIAEAYDAILVHVGGSPRAYSQIAERNITNIDELSENQQSAFARDTGRIRGHVVDNYHGAIMTGAGLTSYLNRSSHRLMHDGNFSAALRFAQNPLSAAGASGVSGTRTEAVVVDIRFSHHKTTRFYFSSAHNVYLMYQFDSFLTDANNGFPVAFSNLLILQTQISELEGYGAGAGRQDIVTTGSGLGHFVTGGVSVPIRWSRESLSSQFVYTFEDGTPLSLSPGKTYIAIIPMTGNVSFS